ncbi:hypothetical protein [Streptomyces sp. NBC_00094]|uniref:hypothetical protein n=1 Tax=Streptomyces sp. NBC_00094 TaxID=2903620 RepID=UPI0022559226|nr:hypothetical protein [Streptomyces sp. NBC_00094]MCX5393717.1 hypothetical protein [Streptomyces sp. NBC_00094]
MTEKNRLTLLSEVDAGLPVSLREEWGRLLLDMLGDVHNAPNGGIKWRWRRVIKPTGTRQLVLGCATRHDPYVQTAFMSYVLLRHHEVTQATGLPEESVTLAVLLTPLLQDTKPWDTQAMRIEGVSRLTAEEIENYTKLWSV